MDWINSIVLFAQQDLAPVTAPGPAGGGAPAPNGVQPACGGQGGLFQLLMIGAIFAVFYFVLIRPQQKRARQHQDMLKALRKGDTVYTQGGIYGRVASLTDNTVMLDVARVEGAKGGGEVRIRVLRNAIAGKQTPTAEGGEAKDAEAIRDAQKG